MSQARQGEPNRKPVWSEERTLGERMLDLADRLQTLFADAAAELGLTPQEARLLRLVAVGVPSRRLAELLGCDAPRLAVLLRTLERAGLVVRSVSRSDRRVRDVTTTPAGLATAERLTGRLHETSPLMTRLDRADRVTLAALLDRTLETP